ncbi:hypothetical protein C2G38_2090589 [Gigaspora rosea]|uniref:Uncharacterized protein n=1 Tax=Gigaspora rosea TaxID=44941 RepID=A0A397V230_9GLOM|nr:hypothetical protein C2G38_2090589 [Gigaspora rosea]
MALSIISAMMTCIMLTHVSLRCMHKALSFFFLSSSYKSWIIPRMIFLNKTKKHVKNNDAFLIRNLFIVYLINMFIKTF